MASAAVGLLLAQARLDPSVRRVIARIDPANQASITVITRAEFLPDGEFQSPRSGRQLQFARLTPGPDR